MENTIILNSGEKVEILFQDEVSLDIDCALRYIKSGEAEINAYVRQTAKPQLDDVIETADKNFDIKIAKGIKDAALAAEVAGNAAVSESMAGAKQELSGWTQANIMPTLEEKAAAAQASAELAQASASSASSSAETAQTASASAAASAAQAENLLSDINVVRNSGDETINDIKTFTSSPLVPTPAPEDNSTKAANTAFIKQALTEVTGVKTGTIISWSTQTPPEGYLKCDGAAVSRTTYAALFAVIGTTYGAGDDETTFNLPNCAQEVLYSDSVPVKGNGITMGLTNGRANYGLTSRAISGSNRLTGATTNYGAAVGSGDYYDLPNGSFGLTTDGAKSGVVCQLPSSADIIRCIKY